MKNPIDVHIGQRLRHRRWFQQMTQKQLAEPAGTRFQQIQKYETGANRISASKLWDIARALDVPVSFFFVGLEGPNRSHLHHGVGDEEMQQKETIELVRAYYAMDEGPRRSLFELAKAASAEKARRPIPDSQSAA